MARKPKKPRESELMTAPTWVPTNAVIHIDLVGGSPQGRAWVNGIGEVAVDTLLGSDANTETGGWEMSAYDPMLLGEHGLGTSGQYPAFVGAARTQVLAGASIVITLRGYDETNRSVIYLASVDGSFINYVQQQGANIAAQTNASAFVEISNVMNIGATSTNRIAFTVTNDRFDLAANGSPAGTHAFTVDEDRSASDPMVSCGIQFGPAQYVQSISIYAPLQSLSALSAV